MPALFTHGRWQIGPLLSHKSQKHSRSRINAAIGLLISFHLPSHKQTSERTQTPARRDLARAGRIQICEAVIHPVFASFNCNASTEAKEESIEAKLEIIS